MKKRKPTHPGEVLLEDIINPLGLTITEASQKLGISRKTLSEIINGRCGLTPETAIRIALATDTSPESWLNMQTKLDLWNALREKPKNVIKFVVSKERYANRAVRLKS